MSQNTVFFSINISVNAVFVRIETIIFIHKNIKLQYFENMLPL